MRPPLSTKHLEYHWESDCAEGLTGLQEACFGATTAQDKKEALGH